MAGVNLWWYQNPPNSIRNSGGSVLAINTNNKKVRLGIRNSICAISDAITFVYLFIHLSHVIAEGQADVCVCAGGVCVLEESERCVRDVISLFDLSAGIVLAPNLAPRGPRPRLNFSPSGSDFSPQGPSLHRPA